VVAGGGNPLASLKEPLVWGTVLGGLFLWQGWKTPVFLTNALELIGQMAIPLMLITLGVAIARLEARGLGRALVFAVFKVIACTGIAWWVGRSFNLPDVAFAVLVLQVATPVAVTSYLLAEKYGADADSVAALVVVSTVLSVITLPLTLAFLL
ncbi:MAG: AEC family transporter, partial [Pseudomonadota bacterium]